VAKRIAFSRKAYADIDRIVEFNNLRNRSDRYSKKFIKDLQIHLKILSRNPLTGLTTDDPEVLVSIWDNYYIFYINYQSNIEIQSIYHQKEDVDR
jgi:plasmid stabilization system protein ParE